MEGIRFDVEQLNVRDREVYDAMNEQEKLDYQKIWSQIEEQKRKLRQLSNASKSRIRREFYSNSRKERKERAHRLIERGAILESYIDGAASMKNEDVKKLLQKALTNVMVQEALHETELQKNQ